MQPTGGELLPENEESRDPWTGVIYPLQMAASIDDAFADPSYVDDSGAGLYCSAAWESYKEDQVSEYVAGHITFNFVWTVYEEAIKASASGEFLSDKAPVRGRKVL